MKAKKILFFSLCLCIAGIGQAIAQKVKYVVMISIDGLRPEFYKDPQWGALNLQQIATSGIYADGVKSVFPTVTYPAHATIATGKLPFKHGIYYNNPFEIAEQAGELGNTDARRLKTQTLWDAARQKGLTTAGVLWPVSVHAKMDFNMSDAPRNTKLTDPLSPFRVNSFPAGLFEEMEQQAMGHLKNENLDGDHDTDDNLARMTAYLIEKHRPNLVMAHLVTIDHFAHAEGRMGPNVRRAVQGVDRNIGRIITATERAGIKDSTAFIIVGDHGFVDIHTQLAPNVWMAKAGLVGPKLQNEPWKAQFFQQGGSTFLYVKDNNEKIKKQVRKLLSEFPTSEKRLFRVVQRDELDRMGADPNVVLALAAVPGVSFSNNTTGNSVLPGKGGTHGFFPDFKKIETGFLATGYGIAKGKVIPQMSLEDIAPMVAKLLNLDMPGMDGTLYPGLITIK